ncbi:hypothetical protein Fmac_007214 [Flemingia macrophylla]|uniref:Uncharacterized protein n=1 Tax=Flemingia macrophylla TaxID=520843 RepID=A0ABD1NCV5_9FABA
MEGKSKQSKKERTMEAEFEDLLPVMTEKLDVETFVSELCGGFKLLVDPETGLITCESLMRNSALLGLALESWMTLRPGFTKHWNKSSPNPQLKTLPS